MLFGIDTCRRRRIPLHWPIKMGAADLKLLCKDPSDVQEANKSVLLRGNVYRASFSEEKILLIVPQ